MPTVLDHNPSESEQAQVLSWLRDYNHAENGEFMSSLADGADAQIFVVSRDGDGKVTGGLQATILHRWLEIGLMAVRPGERDRGIGRRLVSEAERLGEQSGCQYAYVDTMSYQAPEFHGTLGYRQSGRLKDWDSHGPDKIFLTKVLTNRSQGEQAGPGKSERLTPPSMSDL